ncbi:hypothetical protein HPB48_000429 [Haemaphysalis longicornis]|uniref:Hexosyltransferase n=1 Tax=Haemaphysalis longicornis TaxID=44386 RepID=A0A9J6G8A4_HAELO|nr:hypothetical protein HPB48_000429 [Haemaphysalis longicornis]
MQIANMLQPQCTIIRLTSPQSEAKKHKDIVAQEVISGVRQPASSMAALITEWVPSHAPATDLVLRVTDDTYVHVRSLVAMMDRWTGATSKLGFFGRVSRNGRYLESCAYMAKPEAFRLLQPAFADESISEGEGPLLTGRLAKKAGLTVVHTEEIGPCVKASTSRGPAPVLAGNTSSMHLTTIGLSPMQMKNFHSSIVT